MASGEKAEKTMPLKKDKPTGMLESDDADAVKKTKSGEGDEVVRNESIRPFSVKTWMEDLTLEVEGKNLYVSKVMLATFSPVFRKMFEDNVATERLVLTGKKYEEVLEFLMCVYPNPGTLKKIDEKNVLKVVPCAVEYQVVNLLDTCEACIEVILNGIDSGEDLLFYLEKADSYGLAKTKGKCLTLLSREDVEEIAKSKKFDDIPQKLKMEVLKFMAFSLNREVKEQKKAIALKNEAIMNYEQFKKCFLVMFPRQKRVEMARYTTSGCIHFQFSPEKISRGISYSSEGLTSPPVKCGESTVCLKVNKDFGMDAFLTAQLAFINKPQRFYVNYDLVNNFTTKDNVVKCDKQGYTVKLVQWDKLIDESQGFIRDGKIELNAYFMIANENKLGKCLEIESIGISDKGNQTDNKRVMDNFRSRRREEGRFQVIWPCRDEIQDLPENRGFAIGRLRSLANRLEKHPEILKKYNETIQEQFDRGIIEKVDRDASDGNKHYLPHQVVIKPEKPTTKLRVVYDASAKFKATNKSLNECVLKEPVLLRNLFGILLRFRLPLIGMVSDIEKEFLQVGLQPSQRNIARFLWLKDYQQSTVVENNIQDYRFCRVPFGAISSLFLLGATIETHLDTYASPLSSKLKDNTYMDNVITGTDSMSEAIEMYSKSKSMFNGDKMNLRERMKNKITTQDKASENSAKVPGHVWNIQIFQYTFSLQKVALVCI